MASKPTESEHQTTKNMISKLQTLSPQGYYIPFPNNTQPKAFTRLLLELYIQHIVHVFLLVLGFISVHSQTNFLGCLSQDINGFIMCGIPKVNPIHLQ